MYGAGRAVHDARVAAARVLLRWVGMACNAIRQKLKLPLFLARSWVLPPHCNGGGPAIRQKNVCREGRGVRGLNDDVVFAGSHRTWDVQPPGRTREWLAWRAPAAAPRGAGANAHDVFISGGSQVLHAWHVGEGPATTPNAADDGGTDRRKRHAISRTRAWSNTRRLRGCQYGGRCHYPVGTSLPARMGATLEKRGRHPHHGRRRAQFWHV